MEKTKETNKEKIEAKDKEIAQLSQLTAVLKEAHNKAIVQLRRSLREDEVSEKVYSKMLDLLELKDSDAYPS